MSRSVALSSYSIIIYYRQEDDDIVQKLRGEITNTSTIILNKYTSNEKYRTQYENDVSYLRIQQGKEIDYVKTGLRWNIPQRFKRQFKELPYFLLYNYPKKMAAFNKIKQKNKTIDNPENKLPLNVFFSPSPMNEMCDYICHWEKCKILWDKSIVDTSCIILNNNIKTNDKAVMKYIKRISREFLTELKRLIAIEKTQNTFNDNATRELIEQYKEKLRTNFNSLSEEEIANYVIAVAYRNPSISKSFAWMAYGDFIIKNLKANTPETKRTHIYEVPYYTENAYEYLGKYYMMKDEVSSL